MAALPVAKKRSDNPANQSPSPRPPLQQPTLSRMHPNNPIAGIGSVGVREGDRAGIRSHKSANNLSQKMGGGGGRHAKHAQKTYARVATTAQWSCANPLGGCGKVKASRYEYGQAELIDVDAVGLRQQGGAWENRQQRSKQRMCPFPPPRPSPLAPCPLPLAPCLLPLAPRPSPLAPCPLPLPRSHPQQC